MYDETIDATTHHRMRPGKLFTGFVITTRVNALLFNFRLIVFPEDPHLKYSRKPGSGSIEETTTAEANSGERSNKLRLSQKSSRAHADLTLDSLSSELSGIHLGSPYHAANVAQSPFTEIGERPC